MNSFKPTSIRLLSLLPLLPLFACGGCGQKDTDPHEKVDAPGYYNGPMDAHGGNSKPKTPTPEAGSAVGK